MGNYNNDSYIEEDYYHFQPSENPEFPKSEYFFNEGKQNSLYFINNKEIDNSEITINMNFMIPKNFMLNENDSNEPQKEKKSSTENELILKTENIKKNEITNIKNISSNKTKNSKKEIKKPKKYNKHNLIRKAKKIIIDTALEYINNFIFNVYKGKVGNGIFKKELKPISAIENKNTNIIDNINLLNTSLKEIFSNNINKRNTRYPLDINKIIIETILNDENENIKKLLTDLFNKTFLDFILMLKEPEGILKAIYDKKLLKSSKKEIESLNDISKIINDYEKEFKEMKPRKRKNNK